MANPLDGTKLPAMHPTTATFAGVDIDPLLSIRSGGASLHLPRAPGASDNSSLVPFQRQK